jgi:hypothetical protein
MIKITTITFLKISGISIKELGEDETGKLYTLTVDCDIYDSETKEVKTWSITKVFDNLKENELSLENAYIKMMGTFNNSEFI